MRGAVSDVRPGPRRTLARWAPRARAPAALLALCGLLACREDLGLDQVAFSCTTNADCARGTRCEPALGLCVASTYEVACGNGVVEGDEACDVAGGGDARGCVACRVQPFWRCTRERGTASVCASDVYVALAAGGHHVCAITAAGALACEGLDTDPSGAEAGQAHPPEGAFDLVAAGTAHTCARTTSGEVQCWGANDDAGSPEGGGPVDVPADLGRVDQLALSTYGSCALAGGVLRCWGRHEDDLTPPMGTEIVTFDVAEQFGCALDARRELRCWGWAGWPGEDRTSPPAGEALQLGLGHYYGCAVMAPGRVRCWGRGPERTEPPAGDRFTLVTSGWRAACALGDDGHVECWGKGTNGRGSFTDYVPSDRFTTLSAGGTFVCGLRADGTIGCFGDVFGA